jgi:hypothetical protein
VHLVTVFDSKRPDTTVDSIYLKSQEFHTWLVEERKINPETISKEVNKKEFARFVEDFNTGVLCSPYNGLHLLTL